MNIIVIIGNDIRAYYNKTVMMTIGFLLTFHESLMLIMRVWCIFIVARTIKLLCII